MKIKKQIKQLKKKKKIKYLTILTTLFILLFLVDSIFSGDEQQARTSPIKSPVIDKMIENVEIYDDLDFLNNSDITLLESSDRALVLRVPTPKLDIENVSFQNNERFQQLTLEDGGNLAEVGYPSMPFRTVKILLPDGKTLKDIEIVVGEKKALEGTYRVTPAQKHAQIGTPSTPKLSLNKAAYSSENAFPNKTYSVEGIHGFRGYNILVLNIFPVCYLSNEEKIYYYEDMKVQVNLIDSFEENGLFRGLKKDENSIIGLVDVPQLIDTYDSRKNSKNAPESSLSIAALEPASYDYVIITTEALNNSNGDYTFQDLAALKNSMDIQTTIVTVEYIYENYDGADNQTKIRNFIKDAYSNWGIEYVLLGGDGDGTNNLVGYNVNGVPIRGLYGYVRSLSGISTDYRIPCDLYYAGLDGTWDYDEDGIWGEAEDWGDPVDHPEEADLFAEIYIGRAPVDTVEELSNFVRKTIDHEISTDPYLYNALMLGEDMYNGWLYPNVWGADYMEELIIGSNNNGYITEGIPDSFIFEKLYDQDMNPNWYDNDLMSKINEGMHIINHEGHAYTSKVMKMDSYDVNSLENDKYFFGYSSGCDAAAFDRSDSIIECFVSAPNGSFAFIGNSRYGYFSVSDTDGPSQRYRREFYDAIFGEGLEEIGKANQDSKHDNIGYEISSYGPMRWCYFTTNLLGDPTAKITHPPLEHDLSVAIEPPIYPEVNTECEIKIIITNRGSSHQTNLNVTIFGDGIIKSTLLYPSLNSGESIELTHLKTLADFNTIYNITVKVLPVLGEVLTKNNIATELIDITYPYLRMGFITIHGEDRYVRLKEFFDWQDYNTYDISTGLDSNILTPEILNYFRESIILVGDGGSDWTYDEINAMENYIQNGGIVVALDSYNPPNGIEQIANNYGITYTHFYKNCEEEYSYNLNSSHPLMNDVNSIYLRRVYRRGLSVRNPANALFWDKNNTEIFGASVAIGSGHLVVLGSDFQNYFSRGDNDKMFRNILTWQPLEHDLSATLEVPANVFANDLYEINATFKNKGNNDESNVNLTLYLDNVAVVSTQLQEFKVGETFTISYDWTPMELKIYNFTAYAEPIPDEHNRLDNSATKILNSIGIGFFAKNTENPCSEIRNYYANLGYQIDRISDIITEELLERYKIVFLGESGSGWEPSEVSALEKYVEQGGIFVIVNGYLTAKGPYQLATKYGISYFQENNVEYDVYTETFDDSHPLLNGAEYIHLPITYNYLSTDMHAYPLIWNQNHSDILAAAIDVGAGHILSLETNFKDNVRENKFLFNNILTWQTFEHDLSVALEIPSVFELNNSGTFNVSVINKGVNKEVNVNITVYVNGEQLTSFANLNFSFGQAKLLSINWTPPDYGTYNITAYITPLDNETFLSNNRAQGLASVPQKYNMFEVPCAWHDAYSNGRVIEFSSYTTVDLPFKFEFYGRTFDTVHVSSKGYLSFVDSTPSIGPPVYISPEGQLYTLPTSDCPYIMAPLWDNDLNAVNIYTWNTTEFIAIEFHDVESSTGDQIGTFEVVLFKNGDILFVYQSILKERNWETTVGLNYGIDLNYYNEYAYSLINIEFSGLYFTVDSIAPEFEFHDITISLKNFGDIQPNISSTLEATLKNIGTFDEENVAYQLYIDDILVDSGTIPSILAGETVTITYPWTATEYNFYNITIYIDPVLGETHIVNNKATEIKYILPHYNMIEVPCAWYDAYSNGRVIEFSSYTTVDLPFKFEFYGKTFDKVHVSSLGYLSFVDSTPTSYYYDYRFPTLGNQYVIAPFWGRGFDYDNKIYAWNTSEFIVIEYHDYESQGDLGTFEVVLFANGDILFFYKSIEYDYMGNVGVNFGLDLNYYKVYNPNYPYMINEKYFGLCFTHDSEAPEFEFHDIVVSLENSGIIQPNISSILNATFTNIGTFDEENVAYQLYIDDILVDSGTIPSILAGETVTITYPWTATEYNFYNITVYIDPVLGETHIANNKATEIKYILPSYNMIEVPCAWYDAYSNGYDLELSGYYTKYATVDLPFSFEFYGQTFDKVHVSSLGYLSFVDSTPRSDYYEYRFPTLGNQYVIAPFWGRGSDYDNKIYAWNTSEFIVIEYHDYESQGDLGTFEVVLFANGDILFFYKSIEYDYMGNVGVNSGLDLNYYKVYNPNYPYMINEKYFGLCFTHDSEAPEFEFHDIFVSLDISEGLEPTLPTFLNATFTNIGTFEEENIDYRFYIDDVLVYSGTILSILAGESETISYEWTPQDYTDYNFTVYAEVLPNENLESNNKATKIITVEDIINPVFILKPKNYINCEYGSIGNNLTWVLFDLNPDYYWIYQDGDLIKEGIWIANNPINISIDSLVVGRYQYRIRVRDLYSNYRDDYVYITVEDTIRPEITPFEDITYEYGSTGNIINWTLTDLRPNQYYIYRSFNGNNFEEIESETWISGEIITYNIDNLDVGTYTFLINATDLSGNFDSRIVIVTILSPSTGEENDTSISFGNYALIYLTLGIFSLIIIYKRKTSFNKN